MLVPNYLPQTLHFTRSSNKTGWLTWITLKTIIWQACKLTQVYLFQHCYWHRATKEQEHLNKSKLWQPLTNLPYFTWPNQIKILENNPPDMSHWWVTLHTMAATIPGRQVLPAKVTSQPLLCSLLPKDKQSEPVWSLHRCSDWNQWRFLAGKPSWRKGSVPLTCLW